MQLSSLAIIVLLAATVTAFEDELFFPSRKNRRLRNLNRRIKDVGSMATNEPTHEPTKKPTGDCSDKTEPLKDTRSVTYLYKHECEDANKKSDYSYGELDDVKNLKECAKKCGEILTTGLVGVNFCCAGEDEGTCKCLVLEETKASLDLKSKDFDDIDTKGDATTPPVDKKLRLNRHGHSHDHDEEILCARVGGDEIEDKDTLKAWGVKEA